VLQGRLGGDHGPLAQALDLELVRDLEEGLKGVLGDVHLAEVDEVHEGGEVGGPHVRQEQHGVLCGVDGPEDVAEVAAAGAEDDPVGLDGAALAGQGHVREVLVLPQRPERLRILLLVVVPPEAEVLILHRLRPHGVVGVLCQGEAVLPLCTVALEERRARGPLVALVALGGPGGPVGALVALWSQAESHGALRPLHPSHPGDPYL